MVLEDVANRARLLVVAGARADAERLGDGDLHVVDELAVPDGLEDAVRESQRQHVLHGLFAQVVVDAKDLVLVEVLGEGGIECGGRSPVVPERLLDDQPRPAVRASVLPELSDDRRERGRRHRQVIDAVARGAPLHVQLAQCLSNPADR